MKTLHRLIPLRSRAHIPEQMDDFDKDEALLSRALRYLRGVNRWLGGYRAVRGHFLRVLKEWPKGKVLTILDIGTGSADIPREMLRWAEPTGVPLRIIATDKNPLTLAIAKKLTPSDLSIQFLCADALNLPLKPQSVDLVHCSLLLHHFQLSGIHRILDESHRVARRAILISDLIRRARAYLWIRFLTLISGCSMVQFDGPASVRNAFSVPEVEAFLRERNDGEWRLKEHFGHRFSVVIHRSTGDCPIA